MKKILLFSLFLGLFTACNDTKNYKNEVCVIGNEVLDGAEPNCKESQVLSYRPNSWGNKQLPIIISTYFCDFAYPIVQNEAGVTCIYKRRFNVEQKESNSNSDK